MVSLTVLDIKCQDAGLWFRYQRHSTYVQHESTITVMLTKRLDPSVDAQCCEHRIMDDFNVVLLI
jgi:hypothetical protein